MTPNVPGRFSPNKLKVHLRLAVNRLQLTQQKMASLNASHRKEISLLIEKGKLESARVRVEHIIRDDLTQEAYELIELYCELLLARFGLVISMKECDPALTEAVHSIIYATPRSDIKELHAVKDMLIVKYGREFGIAALENRSDLVSRRVIQKLKVESPKRSLVTMYLKAIADAYKVEYTPSPEELVDTDDNPFSGDGDLGQLAKVLGTDKDKVRVDPSGTYASYDASQLIAPPTTNPQIPPRTSSTQYIYKHIPVDIVPQPPLINLLTFEYHGQFGPSQNMTGGGEQYMPGDFFIPLPHPAPLHVSPPPLVPSPSNVTLPPSPPLPRESSSQTFNFNSSTLVRPHHALDLHYTTKVEEFPPSPNSVIPEFPAIPSAPPLYQKTPELTPSLLNRTDSHPEMDELAKRFEALKRK